MSRFSLQLREKLNEVFLIEPNDLGWKFLTNIYKILTTPLKKTPFIVVIPLSLIISFFIYLIFGRLIVRLVSFLQYGF